MQIKPLRSNLEKYIQKHNLTRKFEKQSHVFTQNPRHPSLHTEALEPKSLKVYSFRLDRKYRTIFIFVSSTEIEIADINSHYK